MTATMKKYNHLAMRWRPITYSSRAFTDTESRYSQLEKQARAVEWGIFVNHIYLYGLGDIFEVDTNHKPLVPLLSGYRTTAPLRIERMRVHLQGFNYRVNYVAGKKAGSENNEADYNSRHPELLAAQQGHPSSKQAEFKLREIEGEFEKDIMAIMNSSVPEAVTWQELVEETLPDTERSSLKEAISRGYFTALEKGMLGPQYDPIFTDLVVVGGLTVRRARIVVPRSLRDKVVKLAHEGHQGITKTKGVPMYQSVVSRVGQDGGGAHPTLPPVPSSHCVIGARATAHDTDAQRTMERGFYGLLGPNSYRRVLAGHRLQAVQMGRGRVRYPNQCQSGDTQAGQNFSLAWQTSFSKQRQRTPVKWERLQ